MGTYYVHKATRARQVPYSFQCEHCLKDSGRLTAQITATVEENSNYKTLKPDKQEKLDLAAGKKLKEAVGEAHKNATEKQLFADAFKDECPHCGQTQSWSIAAAKGNAGATLLAILFVGAIVCAGVYFTQGKNLQLTLIIAAVFAVGAVGYSLFKGAAIAAKKRKAGAAVQTNLPTIDWAAVQDLLGGTGS